MLWTSVRPAIKGHISATNPSGSSSSRPSYTVYEAGRVNTDVVIFTGVEDTGL